MQCSLHLSQHRHIRFPHEWKPARVLEHSQPEVRLDNDMKMEMVDGNNIGPKDAPHQPPPTSMVSGLHSGRRDARGPLREQQLLHPIHGLQKCQMLAIQVFDVADRVLLRQDEPVLLACQMAVLNGDDLIIFVDDDGKVRAVAEGAVVLDPLCPLQMHKVVEHLFGPLHHVQEWWLRCRNNVGMLYVQFMKLM